MKIINAKNFRGAQAVSPGYFIFLQPPMVSGGGSPRSVSAVYTLNRTCVDRADSAGLGTTPDRYHTSDRNSVPCRGIATTHLWEWSSSPMGSHGRPCMTAIVSFFSIMPNVL